MKYNLSVYKSKNNELYFVAIADSDSNFTSMYITRLDLECIKSQLNIDAHYRVICIEEHILNEIEIDDKFIAIYINIDFDNLLPIIQLYM